MSRVLAVREGWPRAVIMAGLRGVPGGGGGGAGVSSFNGRGGAVTLTGTDVTTALGYAPANSASLAGVAFSGAYSDLVDVPEFAAVAMSGSYADLSDRPFIPTLPGDIGAASAAQGALADTAVQPDALASQLSAKVDKQVGYGLSQESFTAAEKAKLAGLEGSHYRGTFPNLSALQSGVTGPVTGDYADVDGGVAEPVLRYIWDESDEEWVAQAGSTDPITAAQVKSLYESNPDTNAFSDAEKTKVGGISAGATANPDTDSLSEGASNLYHTAARVLATVLSGLSLASGAEIISTDSLLVAFGKLQRQINDLSAALEEKQDALVSGTNLKTINGSSLLGGGDLEVAAIAPVVTDNTTARTAGISDAGVFIRFTSSLTTSYTIPTNVSVAFPVGTEIHVRRAGAGDLNLTASSGVSLNAPSGGTLTMIDRMTVTIKKVGSDEWDVLGQTVAT